MRVLMTGGGTGGHVNPALAIASILKEKFGAEIEFAGTERGIENKLVPKSGYPLNYIRIQGLRRRITLENFKTLYYMAESRIKSRAIIKRFKPDIVIGTGGYVCWPVISAAYSMGIPTVLHESNAYPGVAVKLLEKHTDLVLINFKETEKHLRHPEKAVCVGNPLRAEYNLGDYEEARKNQGITGKYRYFILSCGGSMGAERVNNEVLEVMRDFTSKHPEVYHLHATGAIEYNDCSNKFREMGLDKHPNIELVEYIYDMPEKMAAADLVINRAGAITLSELAYLKKPCILIPSPNVTDNHQYKNAKVLADRGAALLLEEKELSGGVLSQAVEGLIFDRERLYKMSQAIGTLAVTDSRDRIYEEIKKLLEKKK